MYCIYTFTMTTFTHIKFNENGDIIENKLWNERHSFTYFMIYIYI